MTRDWQAYLSYLLDRGVAISALDASRLFKKEYEAVTSNLFSDSEGKEVLELETVQMSSMHGRH